MRDELSSLKEAYGTAMVSVGQCRSMAAMTLYSQDRLKTSEGKAALLPDVWEAREKLEKDKQLLEEELGNARSEVPLQSWLLMGDGRCM